MEQADVACCCFAPAASKRPAGRFILRDKHRPSADPEPPSKSCSTDDGGPASETWAGLGLLTAPICITGRCDSSCVSLNAKMLDLLKREVIIS